MVAMISIVTTPKQYHQRRTTPAKALPIKSCIITPAKASTRVRLSGGAYVEVPEVAEAFNNRMMQPPYRS